MGKNLDLNKIIKENGNDPLYIENHHISNLESLQNQQSSQDKHHQETMSVRSSIANFTHQPDDFVHVKKFANINTTYNKESSVFMTNRIS